MTSRTLPALLTLALLSLAAAGASALLHFDLERSAPEAGATISSAEAVRLWFTQVPQEGTTSIRVVDAAGDLVPTGEVTQDATDGTLFSVAFESPPVPGSYTVAWRGMGQDGHVVRDEFGFTVAGDRGSR